MWVRVCGAWIHDVLGHLALQGFAGFVWGKGVSRFPPLKPKKSGCSVCVLMRELWPQTSELGEWLSTGLPWIYRVLGALEFRV